MPIVIEFSDYSRNKNVMILKNKNKNILQLLLTV